MRTSLPPCPIVAARAARYQQLLARTDQGFRIRRKKIVLVNGRLASPVDFFHL